MKQHRHRKHRHKITMDWEKKFPWAKGSELKVIAKLVNMHRKGIDGVLDTEKNDKNTFRQFVKSAAKRGLGEVVKEIKKNGKLSEGRKFKYKKNDWKKYNQLVKRGKSVMIQTAYGDEFAWEDGS